MGPVRSSAIRDNLRYADERLTFDVEVFEFGKKKLPKSNSSLQYHSKIISIHQKHGLIGILLQVAGDMRRPSVNCKEHTHCLFPGALNLSPKSVHLASIRQLLSPSTFNEVMPTFKLKGGVNLLRAVVALEGTEDIDLMKLKGSDQQVLKQIPATMWVSAVGHLFERLQQKSPIESQGRQPTWGPK